MVVSHRPPSGSADITPLVRHALGASANRLPEHLGPSSDTLRAISRRLRRCARLGNFGQIDPADVGAEGLEGDGVLVTTEGLTRA
jgi:hypothetical protein